MRHSTQEEKDDYEAMLERKSTVLTASEEFERLKVENVKLRELVRDIYVQYDGILDWVEIERQMSELGIEVG